MKNDNDYNYNDNICQASQGKAWKERFENSKSKTSPWWRAHSAGGNFLSKFPSTVSKNAKKKPTWKFNFTLEKRWPVSKFSFWLSHRALIDSSWKLMKNYHYDQQYHFQKAGGHTATSFRSRRFNTVCRPFNLFLKIAEMRKKKNNFGRHYQKSIQ